MQQKYEDKWTQHTALSPIYKTRIYSETFRRYCSTHPKCEKMMQVNTSAKWKRYFTSQHMESDK